MPVAAVWGANGFIGNNLTSTLLANRWQLRALTRMQGNIAQYPHELLSCLQLDFNSSAEEMCSALQGVDTAFHCAGKFNIDAHQQEFVTGTRNFSLACKTAKVKRVILLSTLAINQLLRIDPSSPISPSERLYAQSRLAGENEAIAAVRSGDTKLVIARIPMVIGRDMPGKALKTLFQSVQNGVFLHPGSKSSLLNCIGINRLTHILLKLADCPLPNNKDLFQFNECILWKDIVSEFSNALGKPIARIRIPLLLAQTAALIVRKNTEKEKLAVLANQTCFDDEASILFGNDYTNVPDTLCDLRDHIKTLFTLAHS